MKNNNSRGFLFILFTLFVIFSCSNSPAINNCDYIFIIEDDMLIKKPDVFNKYIEAYQATGIHHFNYGPGSPFNRKQKIQFDLVDQKYSDEVLESGNRHASRD